jgi:hypothetical protein
MGGGIDLILPALAAELQKNSQAFLRKDLHYFFLNLVI